MAQEGWMWVIEKMLHIEALHECAWECVLYCKALIEWKMEEKKIVAIYTQLKKTNPNNQQSKYKYI